MPSNSCWNVARAGFADSPNQEPSGQYRERASNRDLRVRSPMATIPTLDNPVLWRHRRRTDRRLLADGRSGQRTVRRQPFVAKSTHRRNPLVVSVVVDQSHSSLLGGASQEKVRRRNPAVITIPRQCQLGSSRSGPKFARHRDHLEGGEAIRDLASTCLIGRQTRQLKDHQVADQNKARLNRAVEPARKLGKATITHPGPGTSVE
jgi:hypothetical protein